MAYVVKNRGFYPDELTQDVLKEVLSYDQNTGLFKWKIYRSGPATVGDIAGSKDKDGYIRISFNGRGYRAARLAWFFFYGEWPTKEVDHINNVVTDNRIENLRLATRSQNCGNKKNFATNTTGFKGVHYEKDRNKYRACIKVDGTSIKLGRFDTPEAAHAAYCEAAKKYFGEFANDGKENVIEFKKKA